MNIQFQSENLSLQEIFASTLIHSLWQGAVVVVCMWILRLMFQKNARLNYVLSLFALIGLVLTSLFTFLFLWNQNTLGFYPSTVLTALLNKPNVLIWFNIFWIIGSSIFLLRFLLSHFYLRKLINHSKPLINQQWVEIFITLKNYFSIQKSIILLHSDKVSSAFLTGVIKPVIIIPTSWVNQLTYNEAECILAHELSHVFNRDHWVNLFIHFSEIVFYFNPAAHILISHIKLERELKADTSACQYLKEPLLYAKLILKIEESASFVPAMTLPFFRQKKQLKRRIESVLEIKSPRNEFTSGVAIFALSISLLFFSSLTIKDPTCISISSPEKFNSIHCEKFSATDEIVGEKVNENIPLQGKRAIKQNNKFVERENAEAKTRQPIIDNQEELPIEQHEDIIAYENNSVDILKQIEREIRSDINNRTTIIYEISNTKVDSSKSVYGGNWIIPTQPKCYAPAETKTYIIIKSRKNSPFEMEHDWNAPGKVRIQYNGKN